ncbi:MAG: RidA family protein [Sphingomonas sp.]|nr:RidA family protein [Sphingomonas sp.]
MRKRPIDPTPASYAQAMEVTDARRLLFVSGQVPADEDNHVPEHFADQARLAWSNLFARLEAADMSPDDLVKVTIFLSDRRHREENAAVRREMLGEHSPALTIIIAGIWDEQWLLEIEAIAAA